MIINKIMGELMQVNYHIYHCILWMHGTLLSKSMETHRYFLGLAFFLLFPNENNPENALNLAQTYVAISASTNEILFVNSDCEAASFLCRNGTYCLPNEATFLISVSLFRQKIPYTSKYRRLHAEKARPKKSDIFTGIMTAIIGSAADMSSVFVSIDIRQLGIYMYRMEK